MIETDYQTPVPTIHVSPQQRNIIGYSPIYGPGDSPAPQKVEPGAKPSNAHTEFLLVFGVWSIFLAGGVWWGASSYFGGDRLAAIQQRHDAAMGYAEQLQSQTEQQQRAIDSAREALGCPVGGAQ